MDLQLRGTTLTEEDVSAADAIVRAVGKHNRNAVHQRELIVLTSDINDIRALRIRVSKTYHRALGWCWPAGYRSNGVLKRAVWMKRGQERADDIDTVVHELCHGYAGLTISHEMSFRRFVTMSYYAVLTDPHFIDDCPLAENIDDYMFRWALGICTRYQRVTHHDPYEAERSLQAAQRFVRVTL